MWYNYNYIFKKKKTSAVLSTQNKLIIAIAKIIIMNKDTNYKTRNKTNYDWWFWNIKH